MVQSLKRRVLDFGALGLLDMVGPSMCRILGFRVSLKPMP